MQVNAHESRPTRLTGARLAARFLFPLRDEGEDSSNGWEQAAWWFVPWGLAVGLVYMLVYRLTWRVFGEYQQMRLMPVAVLLIVDQLWLGYRLIRGAAHVAGRTAVTEDAHETRLRALLFVVLMVILRYSLLLYLPAGLGRQYPEGWRSGFTWLYPDVVYAPLVLMPLWGRWAMMLALGIGRTAPEAGPRLRRLAEGNRLWGVMLFWLAGLALTVLYCCPDVEQIPRGLVIAVGVIVVGYLVAYVLGRCWGGQTEATIGAAGFAGEMAFLSFYLPNASAIYWY